MNAARVLRYARRRAGLTQRQLAERAGVPQPTVARVETGKTIPRVDTFDRLLRACGISLEPWPLPGVGEDRTILNVDLDPADRLRYGVEASNNVAAMLASARRR